MQDNLKEGEVLFANGKLEEAEKCFVRHLEKNSRDVEALNNLGVIYYTKGNVQEAKDYFWEALAIKADDMDALLNLADLYESSKQWKEAAAQLEKCTAIDNLNFDLFNRLGMVYLEIGDTDRAQFALETSLKLNPDQEVVGESLKALKKRDSLMEFLPKSGTYRTAFMEIDITPTVSENNPIYLQGMGGPSRKATSVSSRLMMQLLLLEDDHFTRILFVAADLFGFDPEIVNRVRSMAAQWGIQPEGLILNASHNHYAPGTVSCVSSSIGPYYHEYSEQIAQTIIQQLPILYKRLEECQIFWGKTEAQIGVNRRLREDGKIIFAPNPKGYYDRNTPFLVFHLLESNKKVLLVSHGCHPTGLGDENALSADYPGYMRDALKSSGVVDGVIFLQGGAGSTKESAFGREEIRFSNSSRDSKENGEFLANQIMKRLEDELQIVKGSLFCIRRQVLLPLKQSPPLVILDQIRNRADTDNMVRQWADSVIRQFPNGNFPTSLNMEIQLISMGDNVSFVVLPGEPVAELVRNLRALVNKSESTFVLGYTNGLIGYLPTDIMIEEGGYETEGSRFVYLSPSALDSGSEPAIISATKDCITDSLEVEKSNGYGRYHLAHGEQKAFFVLSAGRCGTMTLAHIFDTATNARVWHHPQPDPIRESLLAYWGDIDKRKAFWKARYSIIHKTWSEGLIHGETDLLMTPFCDMIAEEIPDSKFIVLVRDPRDFVRSGMRRNYYQGHAWDFGRLRPKEDTKEFARWNRLDQFRKVCWLWNKTYQTINQIVDRIAKERVFTVRFKDLITGNDNAEKIFKFLGLEGFNEERIQKLLSKKLNAQVSGTFPKPEDWPKQLNETLWNECGSIADEFGYSITYGARKSTKCTRNNQLIDLKGKPCKQTLERDHPSSLINQEGIQANGQSCTDLMLTRNRKKPNIAEKTCVSSIAFLSLFKSLNIKEYGYSDERLPFVQLDNGLKFYGLPNNESVNSFYDDLDQDIRKEFSRDIVAVILDIKNRFYKQKQHRKFQYRQGNTVLELGAYLGYYSMYVAQQVGPSGRVIAVEFLPENYQLLEKNLLENFPKSTQPVLKGIWSEKTKKTVYCGGSQLNSFKEEVVSLYTKHMETIEVETDTVDNITSSYNIKEIDLVIIQLNGNELEALKGMRYSLSFTKNLAIAANYDSEGSNACDVICNFLHKNGFITEVTDRWVYAKQKKKHYTLFESQKCPIFIGGCGRSGTTLMRVMLDSHKNIACGPESYLAVKDNINIADLSFKFDMPAVEIEQLAKKSFTKSEFIDNFLSTYALLNGKKRWAEKTPKNVYRIDYIFNQFKNAKFIHMIRDGRDVACSLRTHPRFKIANGELVPTNICHPIEMGISRWIKDTTAGLLGRNFKGYIEVKYEDLVLNNEETLKKLFDFLEEPWDVNVLNYYRIKSGSRDVNKAPQNPEAFKEIQLDSLGRWYREFLPQDVAIFKEMAGDLLIYLGYVTSYSWDLSMSKRQRG